MRRDKTLSKSVFFAMQNLPIQLLTLLADGIVFLFLGYYILKLRAKEKELEKREMTLDSNYHHVVDEAMAKEQRILSDAGVEAQNILKGAQQLNDETKKALDEALLHMSQQMQQQTAQSAQYFMTSYQSVLQQLANSSLSQFQATTNALHGDLQKQLSDFRASVMPALQKELEEYKVAKMKETEQLVSRIVQKASQDLFNKTISLEDHHKLMLEALEKARKEGVFD